MINFEDVEERDGPYPCPRAAYSIHVATLILCLSGLIFCSVTYRCALELERMAVLASRGHQDRRSDLGTVRPIEGP
jgi:hypothetical protein